MADYDAFIRRVFFDNPNTRRFRTSVVMDRVTVGPTVPVEGAERPLAAGDVIAWLGPAPALHGESIGGEPAPNGPP